MCFVLCGMLRVILEVQGLLFFLPEVPQDFAAVSLLFDMVRKCVLDLLNYRVLAALKLTFLPCFPHV